MKFLIYSNFVLSIAKNKLTNYYGVLILRVLFDLIFTNLLFEPTVYVLVCFR